MSKNAHIFMPPDHMEELYSSKNPLVRFVHNQRLRKIAAMLPKVDGAKFLDAGCGEGQLIEMLYKQGYPYEFYGVDITTVALEQAKSRNPRAHLKLMDISSLDFEDNYFDFITCTEVIEHIFDYTAVVNELKRVLKIGGKLIFTYPNEFNWTIGRFLLARRPIKIPDHINSFNPRVIQKTVRLPLFKEINLPFGLPFFLSLGCIQAFKKI